MNRFKSFVLVACSIFVFVGLFFMHVHQAFGAGPTFVQEKDSHWFGGSGKTESVVFGSNIALGNLVVCQVSWQKPASTLSSVKDSNNANYILIDSLADGVSGKVATYYLPNSVGGGSAKTITATWSADPGFGAVTCQEVFGVATSSPVDSVAHKINTQLIPGTGANAVTSGSMTSGSADYIFGGTFDDQGNADTWTAGTNVAFVGKGTNNSFFYNEYFIQSTAGAVAADFKTNKLSAETLTSLVSFKPAGSVLADTTPPSTPANFSASPVSQSQINLSWATSTDNVGVTGYTIYRNGTQIGTTINNSYSDIGLTVSTLYTYTVDAFDAAGNHSSQSTPASATTLAPVPTISNFSALPATVTLGQSSVLSWNTTNAVSVSIDNGIGHVASSSSLMVSPLVTTTYTLTATSTTGSATTSITIVVSVPDTTPPSIPTNLSATAVSSSQINLSWTPSTDNVGVTGYKIYRNAVQVATSTLTSYADIGLSASTTYAYTVSAFDLAGNVSSQSMVANATTPVFSAPPASFVQGNSSITFGNTSLSVSLPASVSAGNVVVVGVKWYGTATLNTLTSNCVAGNLVLVDNPVISSNDQTAQGYGIINSSGQCTVTANFSTSVTSGLLAEEIAGINTQSPLDGHIMQSQNNPGTGTNAVTSGTVTTTNAGDYIFGFGDDTGSYGVVWTAGTNFVNRIFRGGWFQSEDQIQSSTGPVSATFTITPGYATVTTGIMAFRSLAGGTPPPPDTTPPSIPTNLSATAVSSSQINLSWTPSTDNVGVTGYKIYRNAVQVATSTLTSYADIGLSASTTYAYTVSAFDLAGNVSSQSTGVSATTPGLPVGGAITLVHQSQSSNCVDAVTCSVVLSGSVSNGDLLVISASTKNPVYITGISAGGTFTDSFSRNGSAFQSFLSSGYVLSAVATAGPIVVNFSGSTGGAQVNIREYSSSSGTLALDAVGDNWNNSSSNSFSGVPLTLSGSNDLIVQQAVTNTNVSTVASPYANGAFGNDETGAATADLTNVTSAIAPLWTGSQTVTNSGVSAMAFGFNPTSCTNSSLMDSSGGLAGNAPTPTDLALSTFGATAGGNVAESSHWAIINNTFALTYSTNAHHPLINQNPRFCVGGSTYSDTSSLGVEYDTTKAGFNLLQLVFPDQDYAGAGVSQTVTTGMWFKTSLPQNATVNDDMFTLQTGGDFINSILYGNGNFLEISPETHSGVCTNGTPIPIDSNTWYWITEQEATNGGTHKIAVYGPDGVTQIGSTITCNAEPGFNYAYKAMFGNGVSFPMTPGYTIDFDKFKACYLGNCPFPLLP